MMTEHLPLILVAIFISVACAVGVGLSTFLRMSSPERKRLRALVKPQDREWDLRVALTDEPNRLAERICRVLPRSEQRMGEMRQRLMNAGYRSPVAPVVYAASQIGSALVVAIIAL